MVSPGDPHTETTPESVSKLNFMTLISGTGAELAALDKSKFRLATCTSTGSGFTLNHVYITSTDATTWIDISSMAAHTHTSSSDGGDIVDVIIANPNFFDLCLTGTSDLKKAQWTETIVTTGTITDEGTGERDILLSTGTTSGGAATIQYPHLVLGFSERSVYQTSVQLSATTSLAFHTGVNADNVTAADSTTQKYNAEVCTATNTNWFLRSADGTTATTSDSGTAFTTGRVAIAIEHYPDLGTPRLDMYLGTTSRGTVFQKTTNIPVSSTTVNDNLIKHSLKNSTTANKTCKIFGSRLRFTAFDTWI